MKNDKDGAQMNFQEYSRLLLDILHKIRAIDFSGRHLNLGLAMGRLVREIAGKMGRGTKVIIIGNGGSASIANHMAVDLWKNAGVKALSFSDSALLTCVSNDFGYQYVFSKPIEMFAKKGDLLVAISSSGKSANILEGVDAAKSKGCRVVTMSGFKPDNALRSRGDLNFYVSSHAYGFVEIAHLTLCHYLIDAVITINKANG
jgi:D-sedoheptulose 7-phosphate isomerase